jgi:hypothetical protein
MFTHQLLELQLEIGVPMVENEKEKDTQEDESEEIGCCVVDLSTDDANKSIIEEYVVNGQTVTIEQR